MFKKYSYFVIPGIVLAGLALGLITKLSGHQADTWVFWMVTLIVGALPLVWRIIRSLIKGKFGVDLIAITAIVAAFLLQQYLAGAVIVLMLSGGEALEAYALQRARRELSALISRAPSLAHKRQNGQLIDVAAAEVRIGDLIIIKPGEVVAVDGIVMEGISEVDESALTGEPIPVEKRPFSTVLSGSINKHNVLEIKALRAAAESKYEQIIKLIREAESTRAPVVRLADRYSVWFTGITFLAAAGAWFISHDPIRLLAVLVVATPCPLILATPIAIISGISKSASRGVIVKNGGALEKLGEIKALIFDKTGTLTLGTPEVTGVETVADNDRQSVLKLAASLDQLSAHVLAVSLTQHAVKNEKLFLDYPQNFQEFFGDGVVGEINGIKYFFGKLSFLENQGVMISDEVRQHHQQLQEQGKIVVYLGSSSLSSGSDRIVGAGQGRVGEGSKLLGAVYFADVVRPEIKNLFANIYRQGIKHIVMLTGDKQTVAEKIGKQIGLTDIHAEALPEDKVREIKEHQKQFGAVAMIGDGINDAPALASADVGISIGGHGSTATSDTSDIVITVDNLERVGQAIKISRQVMRIAKQGIFLGMGVSILLMIIAALGHIQPVYGALLQEVLDVVVILNALRVNFEQVT